MSCVSVDTCAACRARKRGRMRYIFIGGIPLKTYSQQKLYVLFTLMLIGLLALGAGCAQKKPTQAEVKPPPISSEPKVIELADSKLADALKEGDIPEEDRNSLSWLPKRPPMGTQFEDTSELKTIYFEFDKYSLTAQARKTLEENAVWLKDNPDVSVQIEGHCDERGTEEYNMVLGDNRAVTTKKYLVTLGIDPDRVYTISYGETTPVDPGHTEEAWAKNRRAQFKIGR
jgi:peptidoglycan-associated lipoprotein